MYFKYYGWNIYSAPGVYIAWPPQDRKGALIRAKTRAKIKDKILNHFLRWGW